MSEPLVKQPAEARLYDIPFAGLIPAGQTIGSVDSVVQAKRDLVGGSVNLVLGAPSSSGTTVQVRVSGGTGQELYRITTTVTDSAGQVHEVDVELFVLDIEWIAPDGAGVYASIADMVTRFGITELVELTDRSGIGRIDPDLVQARLADAAGTIDGYVGKRYNLPLINVPALIKTLACDIARYHLFEAPTAAAGERYRAALQQLTDISAGSAVLDIAGAGPILTKSYTAEAAVTKHRIVKFGAADGQVLHAAAVGDDMFGVTGELDAAIGVSVDVHVAGIAEIEFGGTIARGALVTADASGRAVAAAPAAGVNNAVIGRALVSGVLNDFAPVLLAPGQIQGA